ncbi:hypothetical protein D9C01_12905, partial [Corynebacterium diphtheriae]
AEALRNQILERLDAASLMVDAEARRRALTFVVVRGAVVRWSTPAAWPPCAARTATSSRCPTRTS